MSRSLTATLVALGAEVIAVEPDPAMLTELRRSLPAVRALQGSAEAAPLPDASVDAVLAGNAMHWFDMDVAGPEIARVLVPDGILASLWNVFDNRVDWVAGLERVSGSAAIGLRDTFSSWRAETAETHLPTIGSVAQFGSPEQAEFPHGQRRTADSLVATLATKAGMLVMPEQKQEATLARIRAFLASRPETARGEFTLPMLTGVLRVRDCENHRPIIHEGEGHGGSRHSRGVVRCQHATRADRIRIRAETPVGGSVKDDRW